MNYKELTDKELVGLYREGDDRSFETIYFRYKKRVLYRIKRTVKIDRSEIPDIEQEVWIAIAKCLKEQFDGRSSLWTYLYKIAFTRTINYLNNLTAKKVGTLSDHQHKVYNALTTNEEIGDLQYLQGTSGWLWHNMEQYMEGGEKDIEFLTHLYHKCLQEVLSEYSDADKLIYLCLTTPDIQLGHVSDYLGLKYSEVRKRSSRIRPEINEKTRELFYAKTYYYNQD